MGLGHSPSIPTSGLVFHMDPGSTKSYSGSGTTVTDLSGNGNNGTLTSSPTYQYLNINRFGFNGTSSYIDLSNPSSLKPSVVSVCAWVRTTDLNRQSMIVDGNYQGSGQGYLLQINASNQALFACRLNSGTFSSASGTTSIAANTWYHLVGTYDGTTIRVYVNGVLEGSTAYSGGIGYSSQNIAIGVYQSLISGYSLNGYVGPVQIYNRAITAAEVAQVYAAGSGRHSAANLYHIPIKTDNLFLFYDMGNPGSYSGSGSTSTNLAGATGTGTWAGTYSYSASNGGYLSSTNGYATVSLSNAAYTSLSFAGWFYFTARSGYAGLLFNRYGSGSTTAMSFNSGGTTLGYHWNDDAGTYGYSSGLSLPVNTWLYCGLSVSPTTAIFYVNGQSVTRSYSHASTTIGAGLNVFRDPEGRYLSGRIATVTAYSSALAISDFDWNFNAMRGRFGV